MAKKQPDLAARFARISEAVESEAEKALHEIGVKIKDAAVGLAPVKSGKLKSSYGVRMRYRGRNPVVQVGTVVNYGKYIDRANEIDGHAFGKKLRPTGRVLYEALDSNEADIERMITDAIGRGLGAV